MARLIIHPASCRYVKTGFGYSDIIASIHPWVNGNSATALVEGPDSSQVVCLSHAPAKEARAVQMLTKLDVESSQIHYDEF
jgi:hypothetical protein